MNAEVARGRRREHVYNASRLRAVAFILLLALPSAWRRVGLRVVPVVVDVNDVFISNGYTRLIMGISYLIDVP